MSDADLTDDAADLQAFARELSRIQRQAATDDVRFEVTQAGAEITLRYRDAIRTPAVDLTEPETMTDGGLQSWAEETEDGYRCTVCGNEASRPRDIDHDCIYQNDLVADGGWIVTSEDSTPHPKLSPAGRPHWSELSTMCRDLLALLVGECGPCPASVLADHLAGTYGESLDQDYVAHQTDALAMRGLAVREDGAYRATSEGRYVARSYAQWIQSQIDRRRHGGGAGE